MIAGVAWNALSGTPFYDKKETYNTSAHAVGNHIVQFKMPALGKGKLRPFHEHTVQNRTGNQQQYLSDPQSIFTGSEPLGPRRQPYLYGIYEGMAQFVEADQVEP